MANKNSIYVNALTSFILDTKPYRCKLTEIQEIYQFSDQMVVHVDERNQLSVMAKAAWPYSFFSDGVSELAPGVGKPMPFHQLASPLARGHSRNSDQTRTRGAFKAFRDENTDLPLVPFVFDPKAMQGSGLSDAFVQRDGLKALNEPILEGHDVFLSKGAYVFQIKQTVNSQPSVVGRFTRVYDSTDAPFPRTESLPFTTADSLVIVGPAVQLTLSSISITGPGAVTVTGLSATPNYDALFTERQHQDLLAVATSTIQLNALDVTNSLSAVNQVKALLNQIAARLVLSPNAAASTELAALMVTVNTPLLPNSYEALFNALIAGGTPVLSGYVGWVGQDSTAPYTDRYVDQAFAALSPALYFNQYSDLSQRENASLMYADVFERNLELTAISADAFSTSYEEYTLEVVSGTFLTITGSSSGPIGVATIGSQFSSTRLAFNSLATGPLTNGDKFLLTPKAKITAHPTAPLETWSLISTNPIAYTRPVLTSTRYGYVRSLDNVKNFVTVLDTGMQSTTIVLTATSATTFVLTSTAEPLYTGSITVNSTFNDGRLGFQIVNGSSYTFVAGDKFFIELINESPTVEDLDLYYGYDMGPFSGDDLEPEMVYNTVNALLPNFLQSLNFGHSSRFTGYDLNAFGLILSPTVVDGRTWRLVAIPDLAQPLPLHNVDGVFPTNQINVIATNDPLNPVALAVYDMANDVTSEGAHSGNDPDVIGDLLLYYATSFSLEYAQDIETANWVSVGTVSVGTPYSSNAHGLAFTIHQGDKPFIAGILRSSRYGTLGGAVLTDQTTGGDVISWRTRNAPPVQVEPASIISRNSPRLIMYGESFYDSTPARWTLSYTGPATYSLQGVYTTGVLNGTSVFSTPITVDTGAVGRSYRNTDHNIHYTVVNGVVGLQADDSFTFETFGKAPTILVHGSVSGWQPDATIGKFYWNGKIGFKIPTPKVLAFDSSSMSLGLAPWSTAYGTVALEYVREDAPSALYVAKSHTNGHWTLYRDGVVVSDGTTVLADRYIKLSVPAGVLGAVIKFSLQGHDYSLCAGNDLAIIRTDDGRKPTTEDFVLLERTESDTLQISIKAYDTAHQTVLNELGPVVTELNSVNYVTSGVPLSATSPETAVTTGWLPILETRFDRGLSVAEFSDAATHVVVRAAATGETIGTVESIGSTDVEPVVFRWNPDFHQKYLSLNSEATIVALGSGLNDRATVRMCDRAIFLQAGGGLLDDPMFSELVNVGIAENPQWLIRTSVDDAMSIAMADGPFSGFLPGYDTARFDFETGAGDVNDDNSPDAYYDAGTPLTEYFQQAQSLALLPSMTAPQRELYDSLTGVLGPYLDGGDVVTTTLTEFLSNVGANPPTSPLFNNSLNWSNGDFGIPTIGMAMEISQRPEGSTTASVTDALVMLIVNAIPAESTAMLFSEWSPPLPGSGLPVVGTAYADFDTPLTVGAPGARVVVVSFLNPVLITPTFYIWLPGDAAPTIVSVVDRLNSRRFRFSLLTASAFKLIVV